MRAKKSVAAADLKVRHLADGTEILPIINGKEVFPELVESAVQFERILESLPILRSRRDDPPEAIKVLLHLARHYCDLYGVDFQTIDREAHADYSGDRWAAHEAHSTRKDQR